MSEIRVRFAPSPTGPLHIGGVRTALFNYLFAKKNGGTFYLRIEDTDQTRFVEGAEKYILESLEWLGISPDETIGKNEKYGPYRQSDRKDIYKKYVQELIDKGWAYYAFDTAEELDGLRAEKEAKGETFVYNHSTRGGLKNSLAMSESALQKLLESDTPFVVRFKVPENEVLHITDIIRGEIKFETSLLDDKVLFKSDGMPTYHLANIVDDHLQKTSHVIRGEEWLPSLPLHVMLYQAFGWEVPQFAHLPLILKPIGNGKLSKRDGDKFGFPVFPLTWNDPKSGETLVGYREKGFFPEAVVNFLALLGWNDSTEQELYSLAELEQVFDLQKVSKSGAKFDPEKNKWFNHQYLIRYDNTYLASLFKSELSQKGIVVADAVLEKIVGLVKDRANFITDFWELTSYFFEAPTTYQEKALKNWKSETSEIISKVKEIFSRADVFEAMVLEQEVKSWASDNQIGIGKLMQPLRLSMVGDMKGPDLFDIIAILGKEETISRIEKALQTIKV
ncbi:MAG: glutamate--tRNA ligase [Bacteroidota bacterium]|nr:glutamate--tRNA ligase [Bacteroidota bacterium]